MWGSLLNLLCTVYLVVGLAGTILILLSLMLTVLRIGRSVDVWAKLKALHELIDSIPDEKARERAIKFANFVLGNPAIAVLINMVMCWVPFIQFSPLVGSVNTIRERLTY